MNNGKHWGGPALQCSSRRQKRAEAMAIAAMGIDILISSEHTATNSSSFILRGEAKKS